MTSRFIKIMGLCLVAAFVMSAVAATSAMAVAPEFTFASGNPGFSTSGGAGELETKNGETVKCTSQSGTGEIEGASGTKKATKIFSTFKGCTLTILNKVYKCKTTGANEEEIRTNELLARLGWVNKEKLQIGLLFNTVTTGGLFAAFKCIKGEENLTVEVKGSTIALVTPDEVLIGPTEPTKSFTVTFEKSGAGKGKNECKSFEGEAENILETKTPSTGGVFIESAIKASYNVFPLRSTKITG